MLAETSAVSTLNQVENPLQESNSRSIYRARTFHYANDRSVQLTRSTPVENNWNEIHRVFFRFCYYDRCCCCCCCCCFVSSYYRFFFGPRVKWGHLNITFSLFFFAFWFPHVDPFHKMDPSSRDQLHSQGRDNFICFFTYRMAYGNSISHPIIARCWLCCVSFCFFRFLFVPFSPAFRPLMINGLDCLFLDRFHTSSDEFCLLARVRRLFSFPWLLSGFYCFFFLLVYRDVGVVFMDGCGSVIGCHLGYYRVLSG